MAYINGNKILFSANVTIEEGGGGGGSTTGQYLVQVIDYDGTVLKSANLNTGDTFTLPDPPTHEGLTFQEWSSPVTITNNTITVENSDITVGATYKTTSGLTELDITLTNKSGLTVSLNLWSHGDIDWGDGTIGTTNTHTYTALGNYTIKIAGLTKLLQYILNQSSSTSNKGYILTAVRLAETITTFDAHVFYECNSLKYITIPNSVTNIGNYTFQYCYSLKSITIPNGVTSIGDNAFQYCYSLTSVTIPNNVISMGKDVFNYCYSLGSITIPNGVTSIGDNAFQYCCALTNITIPDGVTSIGSRAFSSCYSLANITIPSNVTSIGDNAFQYCCALTNITIPDGVTSIGNNVFFGCRSLTSITIPSSVTSIGSSAFSECYPVRQYDFSTFTTIPTLANTKAFNGINTNCIIKVPNALLENWKTATNWATYADYMVGV